MEVLLSVLEKSTSINADEQRIVHEYIQHELSTNYAEFVFNLSAILRSSQAGAVSRFQAAIQLKNSIRSADPVTRRTNLERWRNVSCELKAKVRENCLATLGTESMSPSQAAQCIGAIACCDLPIGQWPELIDRLYTNVLGQDSGESLKTASLEAIGYVCQDIGDEVMSRQDSNKVLTAIIHGMRADETKVKLTASTAMQNSLEFARANFEVDHERNFIMQVICESTQSENAQIRVVSLQILVKMLSLYYAFLGAYMEQALFPITLSAMRDSSDEVALQGIEFWSSLCEEETDMMTEISESVEPLKIECGNYAATGCSMILPTLLERLKQTSEQSAEDEEWNPAKAASVCLLLLSDCVDTRVVPAVVSFVQSNISSQAWNDREAAIIAFGSVMVGMNTEIMVGYIVDALPILLKMAEEDPSVAVRDTTHWTIGKICESAPAVTVSDRFSAEIINLLTNSLIRQLPRVAYNACWAIGSLVETIYQATVDANNGLAPPVSFKLSPSFGLILRNLLQAADRPDCRENNLFYAAFETIGTVVKNSAKDCGPFINGLYELLVQRLFASNEPGQTSVAVDLQAVMCATLHSVLSRIEPSEAEKNSSKLLAALLELLGNDACSAAHEDAINTISALCDNLSFGFVDHVEKIAPVIASAISRTDAKQIQQAAIGLFSDICRVSIQRPNYEFCDSCVPLILGQLVHEKLNREVKSLMLSAIGDVALCMGIQFTRHIDEVMHVLTQAMVISLSKPGSDAQLEYNQTLLDNCLLALSGIVNGVLMPSVNPNHSHDPAFAHVYALANHYAILVIDYMDAIVSREELTINSASQCLILGTLVDVLSSNLEKARIHLHSRQALVDFISRLALMTETPKLQRMADWIKQHLRFSTLRVEAAATNTNTAAANTPTNLTTQQQYNTMMNAATTPQIIPSHIFLTNSNSNNNQNSIELGNGGAPPPVSMLNSGGSSQH